MEQALVVENLKKSYGKFEALHGISFEVAPGEIFALIGPNGAGKTTTLRIVATILQPTSGTARVYGMDVQKDAARIREVISYLPEEAGAYKNLTGLGYLSFMAELFASDVTVQREYIQRASDITWLGERLRYRIGTYSKGMTRKLLLSRAVMTHPKLAIIDEQTSGLDVVAAIDIRESIRRTAADGGHCPCLWHGCPERRCPDTRGHQLPARRGRCLQESDGSWLPELHGRIVCFRYRRPA